MDLSLKNMFDAFKDEILKELGPLDPNWFEVLTSQTSVNEGNEADKDDLCGNQEGIFKTPLNKTALDSQLFSTPKAFKHSRIVSPETEDEQSFTAARDKGSLPWMATQSPCLFPPSGQKVPVVTCEGVEPQSEDSFDLLNSLNTSPISYAKNISESLGAQINPNISWTSSLNTPPAVPSTLILSKTDESPCPVSITADRNVVFVRKLFPSLSKMSSVEVPADNRKSSVSQGAGSPEAPGCPQYQVNQNEDVCQLTVPDPDEDEDKELHSTAAGALDGAENVLSHFFANSSSALRKVKPDRIKRRQISPTKENGCGSKDVPVTEIAASSEEATLDLEPDKLPSTPLVKILDPAVSQWSPLSLSELPPCVLESKILTEPLQSDSSSVQLTRPLLKIADSGFVKKKRTFVYTVSARKTQVQEKESLPQKGDPPSVISGQKVKQFGKASGESECCGTGRSSVQNQRKTDGENNLCAGTKVQDFDMSQLYQDFVQDFSQVPNFGQQEKLGNDTLSNFCPSVCLSAMKQAKHKTRQASHLHESEGISNRRQTCSVTEGTMRDGDFQSDAADITPMTASLIVLPHAENADQSQQFTASPFPPTNKGNGKMHFNAKTENTLQTSEEGRTLDSRREGEPCKENISTQQSRGAERDVDKNFIPLNDQKSVNLPEKAVLSLPSVHTSGFKTASNKGIHISSVNLERAKHLFEENEVGKTFSNQSIKGDHAAKHKSSLSNGSLTSKTNSNQPANLGDRFRQDSSQLTASEQADVTELCCLLEEADTQFEFTQFKTSKLKQHDQDDANPSQKPDKELDPDFLAGIDFDDSFSSDNGKHPAGTDTPEKIPSVSDDETNSKIAKATSQSKDMSLKRENCPVAPSSENVSEDKQCHMLTEANNLPKVEHSQGSKMDNSSALMSGVGFTTAGGNVLSVSEKCLRKARALFADLEKNLTDQKSADKQNAETIPQTEQRFNMDSDVYKKDLKFALKNNSHTGEKIQDRFPEIEEFVCSNKQALNVGEKDDTKSLEDNPTATKICQSDFHMASGKVISISSKCMKQADAFFKDCNVMGREDEMSAMKSINTESVESEKSFSKYKNLKVNTSAKHISGCHKLENVNVGLIAHRKKGSHVHEVEMRNNGSQAFKDTESFHENPFMTSKSFSTLCTSKSIDSSAVEDLSTGDGFCTANGKKVFVSADAVRKAEYLLNCTHTPENKNVQPNQRDNASRTGSCSDGALKAKNSGFQTASGKEVAISSAALKKAQALFKQCESGEDEMSVSLPHSKIQVTGPPVQSAGFSAASDKPVMLSSDALQKAKEIFSDISSSTNIPTVSNRIRCDERNTDAQDDTGKMHSGFTTAAGAKVHVLQKNLLKAKELFKESDDLVLTKVLQEEDVFFKDCDVDEKKILARDKKDETNLGQPCPDQRVRINVSKESKHGSTEKSNVRLKEKEETLPQQNSGFQTAGGKMVHISSETLKREESLSGCEGVENKISAMPSPSKVNSLSFRNAGFQSASGKPVTLSSGAIQKAKCLFSDISFNTEIPGVSQTVKNERKHDTEEIHCGFTTAGGAKVHVSQNNLLKAKSLLQELDHSALVEAMQEEDSWFNEETNLAMDSNGKVLSEHSNKAHESASLKENLSKLEPDQSIPESISEEPGIRCTMDTNNPGRRKEDVLPPQKGGFQTASGKAVPVTREALVKAQILFRENKGAEDETHVPVAPSNIPITDAPLWKSGEKPKDAQNNTDKIHCGFTTAGGAKVQVSGKSLTKAKNVLREFAEGECHYSVSDSTSPQEAQNLELSKAKDVEKTVNVTTVRDEDIPAKREDPSEGKSFCPTSGADNLNYIPGQEHLLDCGINQTSHSKRSEVTAIDKSLNLMGCTETQHKLIAQEALDCTKALLEDEVLAKQSLSVTSEDMVLPDGPNSSNRSTEEERRRKRLEGDADVIGHPPSKRRLLEEFDRTVDRPKGSGLHPMKSCPNALMKDRGVFKYSASLHPNVTRPHRDAKSYMETRFQKTAIPQCLALRDDRPEVSKMLAFVPPFVKNAKREFLKNPELKENLRAHVFVPPFKKQKVVLQESSSKRQEEDKFHLPFIRESNSSAYVPPAKKSQNTKDRTISAEPENLKMNSSETVSLNCVGVSSGVDGSDVDNFFPRIQDNLQNTELARDMQDMRIRKKKRQTIRPLPGSLFLTKTSGVARIPLKVAVHGKKPDTYTSEQLYEHGVQTYVPKITSETAESFRFNLLQFVKRETFLDGGGVQLADGGWLIPSNDWTAGKEEFYRALCDTPGVDPKLISEAWAYNHYRWIVWKQASMEKSFPEIMGSLCLTPEQVLLQLKYRYDVEVDHSRRPALRKIMEKDDTAAKTLILCICEIVSRGHSPKRQRHNDIKLPQSSDAKTETPCAVVWLTDGWYAVKAQLDQPLTAMLHKGLMTVGGKLIIHGAQLMGSQDACCPLEAPDSLMLKICANSSRRARWDAKLGFHKDPRPFLLPLSSLYGNGGPVGCVDIIILRSYPIQWMERKSDGGVVFRSARAEEKEARRYDSHKHKSMEMLFSKIQAEFEKQEQAKTKPQRKRKSVSHQDIASLRDGEELYEALGDDLAYLEAHLSEQQLETLHAFRRSQMEKKQTELQDRYRRALEAEDNEMSCPKRDVTPVWRLCIADSQTQPNSIYQLNLWRPSSDLQSLLKEGCRYKVYNLVASDGKKRSSMETLQLTGTKKTQFQDLQASQEWLSDHFKPRVSTDFVNLQNTEFQPLCGEVDLTGCVISVKDEQSSSPAFYLADGKLNFVKVRCFSSFSQAGLEDLVKPGVLLALSNLQLRGQSIHPTPVVYAGDLTVFSTNPKEGYLQESLNQLKTLVQCQGNFFQTAEEKLLHLVKSDARSSISSPSFQPLTPISETDRKQETKTNVTFQKSVRSLGSFTPISRNPPAATSSSEKDPRSLKRKRALDYLSRIPSPPPLSQLGSAVSPCVKKTFNPPRRSGTPSTLKSVQTPVQKHIVSVAEDEWVNDEELAMIDTQALHVGD